MDIKLQLQKSLLLPDFPSGSSITYYRGKLYQIGDDANTILILDEKYQTLDSIHLFDFPDKRIPKPKKADFETSSLLTLHGRDYLLVLGSASRETRTKLILIPLDKEGKEFESHSYEAFVLRMKAKGISEVNVEGSTPIGNLLVLANRGNLANPTNHLIITENDFWQRQHEAAISISEVDVLMAGNNFLGISELCYLESKDILFFTFTSEHTNNAYDDGVIGDSYLGWIEGITTKINAPVLKLNGMINLSDVSDEFKGEKLEGICAEPVNKDEFIAHLISDNDQGQSKLFRVKVMITR